MGIISWEGTYFLENEYLDPFDTVLEQGTLSNLSSGSTLKDESAEVILKLPEGGYKLAGGFTENRLFTTSIPFQAAITTLNNTKQLWNIQQSSENSHNQEEQKSQGNRS